MSATELGAVLTDCCGSSRWVSGMLEHGPFESRAKIVTLAADVWRALGPADWLKAFARHPRIGERTAARPQRTRGSNWSAREQGSLALAAPETVDALAAINREYEQRFGHVYIVCATGRSADDMLALARARLRNNPADELEIAAREQQEITRLRLEKLLSDGDSA